MGKVDRGGCAAKEVGRDEAFAETSVNSLGQLVNSWSRNGPALQKGWVKNEVTAAATVHQDLSVWTGCFCSLPKSM